MSRDQYPASFFPFFSFGNGVGEHAKGRVVTTCRGIQDSLWFWIPDSRYKIPVFVSKIWILDSNLQLGSRFFELYSGFQSPGFWISQGKNSRILESRFPRHGARRGDACSQRPSFPFFYDLWQCVEFYCYKHLWGLVCLSLFLFSTRVRASSTFLPLPW